MYPLLETIRFEDGRASLWPYHLERLQHSCRELWGVAPAFDPETGISIPERCRTGIWKCRILYNSSDFLVEWKPYAIREIGRLIVRDAGSLDYRLKYSDRSDLDRFAHGLDEKEEVLFVRNGMVTDTRYTNVALFNGFTWITPDKPLLHGTRRKELLDMKTIQPGNVKLSDLRLSCKPARGPYFKVRLFNAMIPWKESIELPIDCIQPNIPKDA